CSCPYFEELCKHSIAVLLTHIAKAAPGTRFDLAESETSKENGQERTSKAKDLLEYHPAVSVEQGLRTAFEWYSRSLNVVE
ncbi:MAG: SWIM zinc finger family protein, partial [Bacteroidota bacterium]